MKTLTHWRASKRGPQRRENPLYENLARQVVSTVAKQAESLRNEYRRSDMIWTKMERKMVAETYRELWPGQVTDLEIAMFCKALSYFKPDHILESLYLIFSSQEQRLRPAAGRVRARAVEVRRADPESSVLPGEDDETVRCSPEEIKDLNKLFWEKIGEMPKGIDD